MFVNRNGTWVERNTIDVVDIEFGKNKIDMPNQSCNHLSKDVVSTWMEGVYVIMCDEMSDVLVFANEHDAKEYVKDILSKDGEIECSYENVLEEEDLDPDFYTFDEYLNDLLDDQEFCIDYGYTIQYEPIRY